MPTDAARIASDVREAKEWIARATGFLSIAKNGMAGSIDFRLEAAAVSDQIDAARQITEELERIHILISARISFPLTDDLPCRDRHANI